MVAILVFPVYVVVLILLWNSYLKAAMAAKVKPSPLVAIVGAVAGGVVGFLLLQNAGLFGMYESLDVDGLAGMAVMAPLCAVLAARFSLWLMRNQTR